MSLMKKRMLWMLLGVGLLFGSLAGYQAFSTHMMKKYLASNARPPATVTAMRASYQDWQPSLHAIGSLRAVHGVDISTEVEGQVSRVHVRSGEVVKKGALLVELRHADMAARLSALRADARLAELSYRRDKAQLAARAISQAQFDASAAAIQRSRAAVAEQQALIAKRRITAPFAGRIGIVAVNPGQHLKPGDVIATLQDTKALFVDFHLPQRDVGGIAVGQRIRLRSDARPHRSFTGVISAINPAVDRTTRNVRIEGRIENSEGLLYPGMFVSMDVERGASRRYLTVPQTAIAYNAYGATVFLAVKASSDAGGKETLVARQEFVRTGPTRGDQVAILSGIREGDLIVTSGQMKLKNGTPLVIDNRVQPANDPVPTPQER